MTEQPQTFDASKKPITQTLKTVLEFNHRDINRTEPTQRNKDAHALASVFVLALWLMIVVTIPVATTYGIRGDFRMWAWEVFRVVTFRTDMEMIGFIFILGTVASFLIYRFFFNLAYITIYKDVIDAVHPVSETITETTTQGDTSIMNFSDGTNVANTAVLNNGESIIELQEREENVGGMIFTSDMMSVIRRLAIQSNKMTRDHVWQPMFDEGLLDETVVRHYQKSMSLFTHPSRKWVSGHKWTPNAYRSFLRVDSPHPEPEVVQDVDFDADDDDDNEQRG